MRTCRPSKAPHILLAIAFLLCLSAPGLAADKPAAGTKPGAPAGTGQVTDQPEGGARPAATVPSAAKKATPAPEKPAGGEGEDETEKLAKASQNPVSDMISLPFQGNAYFGTGPADKTTATLNIQPVIPQNFGQWNIIHRAIMPIQYVPMSALPPGAGRPPEMGLGDLNYTAFLSPAVPGQIIWGAGPVMTLPTATGRMLGAGKFSVGPSVVVLTMKGHAVMGALMSQQWSVAGDAKRPDVSAGLIQPFFNYNFPKGWFFTSAPIMTVNWNAPGGQKWTVPLGGGVGRLFTMGKQPVNLSLQAFYNVVRPTAGPDWSLRLSFSLLFPVHK